MESYNFHGSIGNVLMLQGLGCRDSPQRVIPASNHFLILLTTEDNARPTCNAEKQSTTWRLLKHPAEKIISRCLCCRTLRNYTEQARIFTAPTTNMHFEGFPGRTLEDETICQNSTQDAKAWSAHYFRPCISCLLACQCGKFKSVGHFSGVGCPATPLDKYQNYTF